MEDTPKNFPEIDYDSSIKKERIVYRRSGLLIYNYVSFYAITAVIFFGFAIVPIPLIVQNGNYILLLLPIVVALYLFLSVYYLNKPVLIIAKSILENKEDAIKALQNDYDDLTFDISHDNILRDYRPGQLFKSGRVITVIFNGDKVYFHKVTLARGDTMFPFFVIFDYAKSKQAVGYFRWLQIKRQKEILEHSN